MNQALRNEVITLGGDPTDPTWEWFLKRGPHGPSFTWGQTRSEPPGYVGVEHLQEIVDEKTATDTSFSERVITVLTSALQSKNSEVLRRAVQVAAVVGGNTEMKVIAGLVGHEDSSVAADARASIFHLKKRLQSLPR